ncbi:V4R domain-containing protein [Methanothermobacter sp. THM-2]|nr:V4R domain-containing protein [Methanothermobacter sp. THM-2]
MCFFEAGIIAGALFEILGGRVDAYERRCWTNGYSFCQFDVRARI